MIWLVVLLAVAPGDTIELSLPQALNVAFGRSPANVEASASRNQGTISAVRAAGILLPTPSISVSYGETRSQFLLRPDSTVSVKGWTGDLTLSQIVFDAQAFAGIASSIVYSGYYLADARDKQARLLYDVTADYLSLLKARLLRDAASQALDRATDNLRLTEEKYRLGSASRIDVMRSEVFRSQAEIDLLTAEKARATANATFLATAGIIEPVVVEPTEQLTAPAALDVTDRDSLIELIGRSNAGAKLASRSGLAADINLAGAIGRALPSVSAYWSSSYSDSLFPGSLARWDDNDYTSWGIRFSLPLLDIKSYLLDVADANTRSRQARAGAARARLQLRSAATAAVIGYEEARQRYESAKRNLELNEELSRLAEEQHRLGAISLIDLFSVETNLAQAEAAHVSALSDTYIQAAQISYLLSTTRH